ncbi:kinase phosphorylation protein-domain-containing protein [Xylaria sp. FL0064]|nr:kinase phosphorylation protein-domain-containing protein [Xylaria sp. FL0064]
MDLVSGIRKSGSRGGVNFSWEDVATSAHRENYLGHSLKAPVGRWQKGRDLTWYAKADAADSSSNETPEERAARERKEELKKIKEAEEDALARALGLPVAPRNVTGANAVDVGRRNIIEIRKGGTDAGIEAEAGVEAEIQTGEDIATAIMSAIGIGVMMGRQVEDMRAVVLVQQTTERIDATFTSTEIIVAKETDRFERPRRGGQNRSRSRDDIEHRRPRGDGRRSRSRDRRGGKSPQRSRRRSQERD